MAFGYPIALEVAGRRCVVVGGGPAAEQRALGLLDAGACVVVIAEVVTDGLAALAEEDRITVVARRYASGDLDGAFLAIGAGERGLNAQVFVEARARGVLMNSVDDTDHCHFAVPSVLRRGDLVVAVSTGGKAPALSRRLRTALAEEVGPEMGDLVELLGQARQEARATSPTDLTTAASRWANALDHDLAGMVRSGKTAAAREVVRSCLAGTPPPAAPARRRRRGRVSIVGAGPGDPGLITVRGRDRLDAADVVVHDRLVHPSLIEGRRAVAVGKGPGFLPVPQDEINRLLVRLALDGQEVVRLKGGDPFVFGRGSEEAEALARAGVDFEIVPAPTSAIAALAYAGIPVTDRRMASSVGFVTGHCAADGELDVDWARLATAVDTVVALMAVGQLPRLVASLIAGGRDPRTPAAVVEQGTTPAQRVVEAPLEQLAAAAAGARIEAPAIVVVGEVVRLRRRIAWYDSRSPASRMLARTPA